MDDILIGEKKRIEWVDIFKALTIISVVIGHSTGKYNIYIYQFHMAAFFFISGYTTNLRGRGLLSTIWNKFCSIKVPLITISTLIILMVALLEKLSLYKYFFSDNFIGLKKALHDSLFKDIQYINLLGATWFLGVLFGILVLHRLIFWISSDKINLTYVFTSIILLFLGYKLASSTLTPQSSYDLIFIGQFYFFLGFIFKEKKVLERYIPKQIPKVVLLIITCIIMWYLGNHTKCTVDYPSRTFGSLPLNVFAALNGILLVYFLSMYIEKVPYIIKNIVIVTGKNTLGIVFFHFMFFKLGYFILYLFHMVDISYLKQFVPTKEIGDKYWIIISLISLIASIGLWVLLTKVKGLSVLLGQNKSIYENLYYKFSLTRVGQKIERTIVLRDYLYKRAGLFYNNIKIFSIKNKVALILLGIIAILTLSPMIKSGIMCNDEVQARYWGMKGLSDASKHYWDITSFQGRALGVLPYILFYLPSFSSSYTLFFKGLVILTIIITILTFGAFIHKIFKDIKLSFFICGIAFVFLPISFEHTMPNAFVTLYLIPFTFLLFSFICFISFLEIKSKFKLTISMLSLFLALFSYEAFLTFTPMYLIFSLWVKHKNGESINKFLKNMAPPVITSICYIIIYYIARQVFPSNYGGIQLEFKSLKSSFEIVYQLFKSGIPGYYVYNKKYLYLFNHFVGSSFPLSHNIPNNFANTPLGPFVGIILLGKDSVKYFLENFINIRVLLLISSFSFYIKWVLKDNNQQIKQPKNLKNVILIVILGLVFMILPSIPTSISKMYQGLVNPEAFAALPVSFFIYIAAIFVIAFLLWNITKYAKTKLIVILISISLIIYLIPVQAMNSVFSAEQTNNYDRLVTIENFFQTNTAKVLNNQGVSAADLYETRNTLAIHDGYWNAIAQLNGMSVNVTKGKKGSELYNIYLQQDKYLVLSVNDIISVLSPKELSGTLPVKTAEDQYISASFKGFKIDNTFYLYNFRLVDKAKLEAMDNTIDPFIGLTVEAGHSLGTAKKLYGYYLDGWLEKTSEIKILTGNQGKVVINGYYPNDITGNEIVSIYIDGIQKLQYKITAPTFTLEIPTEKNKVVSVKMQNSFERPAKKPDLRKLSFVLTDMQGK